MRVDFHLHILPDIDDGAADVETSIRMLEALKQQEVTSIFATPHFLLHKTNIAEFIAARKKAYQELIHDPQFGEDLPRVYTAAEVAIEPEISRQNCFPLCYENLSAILLELPKIEYKHWMYQEIENIRYGFGVIPVLAHLERFLWYDPKDLRSLLQLNGIAVQINAGAFERHAARQLIQELYERNMRVIVGTDSHNCDSRRPDFDILDSVVGKRRFRKWMPWLKENQEWFLSQERNHV